jgi:hypothetical protein
MPYQVERQTYAVVPYMLWQSPSPPPMYHHELIHEMYASELRIYGQERSPVGSMLVPLSRAFWICSFYLGPVLILPVVLVMFTTRHALRKTYLGRKTCFLLFVCGFVLVGLSLETFYSPHYASPLTSVITSLVVLAMVRLRRWRWHGKCTGLFITRAIPIICLAMLALRAGATPLRIPLAEYFMPAWYQSGPDSFGRAAMLTRLRQLPGRQLVLVRYDRRHDPFEEWVYNEPDIDAANVVWARDMGPADNEKLIAYFSDRHVWLLEADRDPPALLPYSNAERRSPFDEPLRRLEETGSLTRRKNE